MAVGVVVLAAIIPYQELRGDYNPKIFLDTSTVSYHTKNYEGTTTDRKSLANALYHTIPRTTRGLQPEWRSFSWSQYHTIPRTTRGLQLTFCSAIRFNIIPYQELRGDYNYFHTTSFVAQIIPYQELRGDYNIKFSSFLVVSIIPYQELRGDYNVMSSCPCLESIIPYQELRGDYNCALA